MPCQTPAILSYPFTSAAEARFESETENSIGKFVRFAEPETCPLATVIDFRYIHAPLYHEGLVGEPKVAVTLAGPFMVRICGVLAPDRPPLNPLKAYPLFAVALTETAVPLLYHPLLGVIDPPLDGLAAVVR